MQIICIKVADELRPAAGRPARCLPVGSATAMCSGQRARAASWDWDFTLRGLFWRGGWANVEAPRGQHPRRARSTQFPTATLFWWHIGVDGGLLDGLGRGEGAGALLGGGHRSDVAVGAGRALGAGVAALDGGVGAGGAGGAGRPSCCLPPSSPPRSFWPAKSAVSAARAPSPAAPTMRRSARFAGESCRQRKTTYDLRAALLTRCSSAPDALAVADDPGIGFGGHPRRLPRRARHGAAHRLDAAARLVGAAGDGALAAKTADFAGQNERGGDDGGRQQEGLPHAPTALRLPRRHRAQD